MASPAITLKHSLFTYPSIYPEPVNVLDAWFTNIGSYEWNSKGELGSYATKIPKKFSMKYEDLDEREKKIKEDYAASGLYSVFLMQIEAERIRRDFIARNVDTITKDSYNWTFRYFGHAFKNCETGRTERFSLNHSPGLNFPDNITKEWGEVLYRYFDHWMEAINARYVPGRDKEDREKHWPEDVKEAYKTIRAAKARLHPLIREGETWEEHRVKMKEIMDSVFKGWDKKRENA